MRRIQPGKKRPEGRCRHEEQQGPAECIPGNLRQFLPLEHGEGAGKCKGEGGGRQGPNSRRLYPDDIKT